MALDNDPPKTSGIPERSFEEMIDELERIREELLVLQRSMEEMESVNPNGTVKKKPK
jgi:hypothetical protein